MTFLNLINYISVLIIFQTSTNAQQRRIIVLTSPNAQIQSEDMTVLVTMVIAEMASYAQVLETYNAINN